MRPSRPIHPGARRPQAKGGHRFPDNVDAPYRAFIRALDCAVVPSLRNLTRDEVAARGWWPCSGHPEAGGIVPAHLKTQGSGGKDRGNLVGLCVQHHAEQEGRTKQFCAKYGVDLWQIALDLQAIYEAENGAPVL